MQLRYLAVLSYNEPMRVLFICTGNTCRSPMAERLARKHYPRHEYESAGVSPGEALSPLARRVLEERGADAEGFTPRAVAGLDPGQYDVLVLIGEQARRQCAPAPAGGKPAVHFWDIADPLEAVGGEAERLAAYRSAARRIEAELSRLFG